jgi:hypothetical protein
MLPDSLIAEFVPCEGFGALEFKLSCHRRLWCGREDSGRSRRGLCYDAAGEHEIPPFGRNDKSEELTSGN